MAYNDQNDNYKPTPFSVTRDSIATRVNKQGLIEVVGKDKLRIDYTDSSNGVALLEPARTNLDTYSEDIPQNYVTTDITDTFEYGTAPNGLQKSTRLQLSNVGNSRYVNTLTGIVSSGTTYSFSCYYKGTEGETTYMYALPVGGTSVVKRIQFTGNWQREDITFTAGSSSNYVYITDTRQGGNASDFEVWGSQVEAGSYATSYISTSGSTADRAADVANGAGNEQVFNDSEGVLFANIAALANDGTDRSLSLSSGSYSNRIELRYNSSSNGIRAFGIVGGAFQFDSSTSLTLANIKNQSKLALKYKQNDFALWADGFEVYTDLSGSTFPEGVLNKINFSDAQESSPFYGKTKEIGVYDTTLTDAELEALTSYTSFINMANELNLTIK
jgi:hypothetical protein